MARSVEQEVSSATTGDQWKEWEMDLSEYKGSGLGGGAPVCRGNGETTCSFWGKIELLE